MSALVTGFPDPVTQTRDFYAASRRSAPSAGAGVRAALWEASLASHGARDLNARFLGRWGRPMDPSAWAAYGSTKMLFEAAVAAGTREASALVGYLESPEATLDVHKGPGPSFRAWDHQLRQPLYAVSIDLDASHGRSAPQLRDLAQVAGVLPAATSAPAPKVLDQPDSVSSARCRF